MCAFQAQNHDLNACPSCNPSCPSDAFFHARAKAILPIKTLTWRRSRRACTGSTPMQHLKRFLDLSIDALLAEVLIPVRRSSRHLPI